MQNNSKVASRNRFKAWVTANDGEDRVAKLYGVDPSHLWRMHSGPGDKPVPKIWLNIMKLSEENAALREDARMPRKKREKLRNDWDAAEEREKTWYLLYSGTSQDGWGTPDYVGRTTDLVEANRHQSLCDKCPYSIGYVEAVTLDSRLRL